MGGYTLTPVAINVDIEGIGSVVAHRVQIQHSINDFSRCDVSVIARSSNEVVAFKEIFPSLAKAKPFTKMTVSVSIKSGPLNTIKQFSNIWSGTLTGLTPSMSPGSVEFTMHGLGGLFYSGTVCMFSPGLYPGSNTGGGAMTSMYFGSYIGSSAGHYKDIVDLFNGLVYAAEKYYNEFKTAKLINPAKDQIAGVRFDLLKKDLKKIKKVPGMNWPEPLSISSIENSQFGFAWLDGFKNQILSNPAETFWAVYGSACVSQQAQLVAIGDNVILSPTFWLNAPPNADKAYDPINPATNIIYSEDLLGVSPGINPFDAPTRVGTFIGQSPMSYGDLAGQNIYCAAMTEAGSFKCFPSSSTKSGILNTITQQEGLTGARIQIVQPEHWLVFAIATANNKGKAVYDEGGAMTQDPDERNDDATEKIKEIMNSQPEWDKAVHLYLQSIYYREVLASRSGAVQARLRLDCVPGLPCRVIAPWDAFTIDAYVLSVTHVISTTPTAASTMLQFSHARFLQEKVDLDNPMYPSVKVKAALPVFEAAARGSASGAAAGTENPASANPPTSSFTSSDSTDVAD